MRGDGEESADDEIVEVAGDLFYVFPHYYGYNGFGNILIKKEVNFIIIWKAITSLAKKLKDHIRSIAKEIFVNRLLETTALILHLVIVIFNTSISSFSTKN